MNTPLSVATGEPVQPHEWRGSAKDPDDGWDGAFRVPAWRCANCGRPLGGSLTQFTAAMDSPTAPIPRVKCGHCGTVYNNPNPPVILERRRLGDMSTIRCRMCDHHHDGPHADTDRHIALHVTTVHPAHLYDVEDIDPLHLGD